LSKTKDAGLGWVWDEGGVAGGGVTARINGDELVVEVIELTGDGADSGTTTTRMGAGGSELVAVIPKHET
jgi:hypothetical protein